MNSNYELIFEKYVEALKSKALLFKHKKTGARVFCLSNDDDNKVFYIGFRTPPEDNTGVAHIIEHTVLCGSDKYPLKDPFIELAKGSLNTFLNAMTYPDKTVYPVASRNDKDFANLMSVYMDAVFHPNIYKYEEILKPEEKKEQTNLGVDEHSESGQVDDFDYTRSESEDDNDSDDEEFNDRNSDSMINVFIHFLSFFFLSACLRGISTEWFTDDYGIAILSDHSQSLNSLFVISLNK